MKTPILATLAILLAAPAAGCPSMFMQGSEPYDDGYPATYEARYQAPACRVLATGQTLAGPPGVTWFYVAGDYGPALLEIDARQAGSKITNSWRDATGDYFFTAVAGKGWVYAFPRPGSSQTPARYVYLAGSFTVAERGGVLQPVGQPMAVCPMVKK